MNKVISSNNQLESINQIGENSRKVYIQTVLTCGKRQVKCRALIDTGNTVTSRSVITKTLHNDLQSGFEKLGGKNISTAKTGSGLKRLGRSKEIQMKIEGLKRKFVIKPTVVEDLTDDLNLGNGFLSHVGGQVPCSIIYSGRGTKLCIGDEEVELIRLMNERAKWKCGKSRAERNETSHKLIKADEHKAVNKGVNKKKDGEQMWQHKTVVKGDTAVERRPTVKGSSRSRNKRVREAAPERVGHIFCKQDTKIKKNTMTFIPVDSTNSMIKGKEILVEPVPNSLDLNAVGAVYSWSNKNRIAVLNQFEDNMMIKAGTKLAKYSEIESLEKRESEEVINRLIETTPGVDELIRKLKIEENEILKKNPVIKSKLVKMVTKYADVFADPEGVQIGMTDQIEFDIELKPGAKPKKQKLRPLNPYQRKSLRDQVDLWLKEDVIEESNSPWASPLVPAKKKGGDGKQIRWAVDYRYINSMTVADAWPIPSIEENLEKLQGAKYFSALDASGAYHTVPVKERARPYLAFLTPFGTFQYRRMPFGAKNAGACYSRLVELSIMKLRSKNVLAYIDDIICATQELEEHLDELDGIFRMHREAGIKLKAEKTHLIRPEVEYLGYNVSQEGVKMRPEYVEKITQWPTPKTIKELNTWLGFTSYYRSFLPNYSQLTNEMNSMRKEKQLVWTEEMERKFKILKEEFSKMPVRSYPDYHSEEPFQLALDFSKDNVAAILSQVQGGQERFLAAAGRKTTKYERNYHSCKGELSAFVFGLRKYEHLLKFKKFIVWTDSKALVYLQTMKKLTGIYFRWLSEIQEYEFEVRHRPGKQNCNCDALSRCNHLDPPSKEEEEEEEGYVHRMTDEEEMVNALYNLVEKKERECNKLRRIHRISDQLTKQNLIKEQGEDPVLKQVKRWLKKGKLPIKNEIKGGEESLKIYYQRFESLSLKDNIIYKINKNNEDGTEHKYQICVPGTLQRAVYGWSHSHVTSGHFGMKATLLRCQQRFYYPGMKTDLETRVRACSDCLAKIQRVKIRDATHQPRKIGYVGEILFVDLVGPMPTTRNQCKYILTMEDAFSRYCMAVPIPNKEATTVSRYLMDRYVSVFGTPASIHSDQGKEFTAEIFKELMDRLQVKCTTTPTYNPQSNGNLERFHRTLSAIIRVFCDREDPNWDQYLGPATLAYNTKQHSSTGITPYSGMFGRQCKLPIDLIIPTPDDQKKDINVHVRETLDRFKKMYHHVRKKGDVVIRRNAQLYTGKENALGIGTRVWYLAPRKVKGKPNKITDQWIGPYKIVRKPNAVLVEITPADYSGPTITSHMARIVPCSNTPTTKQRVPKRLQLDDQGDELAEEIRNSPDNVVESLELGVPLRFVQPEDEILDVARGPPVNITQPTMADTQEGQRQPDQPGTSIMDTRERDRGMKRQMRASDSEVEEKKQPKIRPKRSREQIENESKRKRQADEEEGERQVPPAQPFPFLPRGFAQHLPDTSESDEVDKLRALDVEVAAGSSVPVRATEGSAAYDVKAHKAAVIPPYQTGAVALNLRVATPPDHFMYLLSRSGLALRGITVEGGVIDSDYTGEIKAILKNSTPIPFKIQKGQRVAQAIFLPVVRANFQTVEDLSNQDGPQHSGFGSTGI